MQATKKESGGSAVSQESDMFEWLATNAGIRDKAVSLSVTAGGYRGLLADGDIAQGQARPAVIMYLVTCSIMVLRRSIVPRPLSRLEEYVAQETTRHARDPCTNLV